MDNLNLPAATYFNHENYTVLTVRAPMPYPISSADQAMGYRGFYSTSETAKFPSVILRKHTQVMVNSDQVFEEATLYFPTVGPNNLNEFLEFFGDYLSRLHQMVILHQVTKTDKIKAMRFFRYAEYADSDIEAFLNAPVDLSIPFDGIESNYPKDRYLVCRTMPHSPETMLTTCSWMTKENMAIREANSHLFLMGYHPGGVWVECSDDLASIAKLAKEMDKLLAPIYRRRPATLAMILAPTSSAPLLSTSVTMLARLKKLGILEVLLDEVLVKLLTLEAFDITLTVNYTDDEGHAAVQDVGLLEFLMQLTDAQFVELWNDYWNYCQTGVATSEIIEQFGAIFK